MENQQMAMPAEMAPAGPNPEEMAIYEQMRQQISPQEFSNEMLAGASQVDPQAVAEFTQELQGLNMPPEVLDALNDVVDEILASPERYAELRAQYMEQGLPEDILPEQFDPQFFAALNMAIDQMIAAPTGVQAFAQGGIAELKPIAKAIASYGRNGDTMLAHITPAEARMLRRRGGSGTINPKTGLPEFFLKKLFKGVGKALKSVGNAVKKFANSTVGRLVATVALGFFLGPAAASLMGVSSVAGVAAVSGFVGSAGSTLLAGGNLKDALKAGAIGGLTAGAGAGVMGGAEAFASGSYTGPTTISGQFDKFKSAITPNAAPTGNLAPVVDAPAPVPGTGPQGVGPNQMPVPDVPTAAYDLNIQAQQAAANAPATILGSSAAYDPATATRAVDYGYTPGGTGNVPAYKPTTIGESFSRMGEGLGMGDAPASFDTFKQGATDLFSPGPTNAQVTARAQEIMSTTPGASLKDAMSVAAKELSPGILRTYGPAAVAGIGAMSAFGGFDSKPVQGGEITNSLMKPVTQRIQEGGTQRQMYMQGLPGVVYDDYGAPVYGQSTRLPTYDVPDYNSGGFGSQGIMNLPSVYIPPPGTIGSRRVEQPYNNADMYSNLVPRGYADGGTVTDLYRTVLRRDPSSAEIDNWKTQFGDTIDERERAVFREAAGNELAAQRASAAELATQQKAARDKVAQQKALRRSQGSGQMYANINAGLSALAPENFPGTPAALAPDRLKTIQDAYAGIAARPVNEVSDAERYQVAQQGKFSPAELAAAFPEVGFGEINRIMGRGAVQQNYAPMLSGQRNAMAEQARILGGRVPVAQPPVDAGGPITTMPVAPPGTPGGRPVPPDFSNDPGASVGPGMPIREMRDMAYRPGRDYDPVTFKPMTSGATRFMNMGGIAGLAKGGYPRRNGQISGPGTEKSDSIPAMLSDGEFVMTAKAVRGAGKGSRRAGAKQMYKLMHQLEKNAERG